MQMSANDERIIELSKTKLAAVIAAAVLFVAAGVYFFMAGEDSSLVTEMRRFVDPWVIHAIGIAAVVLGVAGVVFGIRKSADRRPGLTLSAAGLLDNSSATPAGFVPWSEVTGLSTFEVRSQKMVVVHVADPARYIERGNGLQRAIVRANADMCGSPVVISATSLRISFEELRDELARYLARYGRASGEDAVAAIAQRG
jgi:hypothetical protein